MKIITDSKQLEIDDEFISICEEIKFENKSDEEWSMIESSDMFQTPRYKGGYESEEQEFCFSFFDPDKKEWWFQLNLLQVAQVIKRDLKFLDLIEPL